MRSTRTRRSRRSMRSARGRMVERKAFCNVRNLLRETSVGSLCTRELLSVPRRAGGKGVFNVRCDLRDVAAIMLQSHEADPTRRRSRQKLRYKRLCIPTQALAAWSLAPCLPLQSCLPLNAGSSRPPLPQTSSDASQSRCSPKDLVKITRLTGAFLKLACKGKHVSYRKRTSD